MTYIGRTWFILAEFNFYWQNITSTGRISLPLAEHDLIWLIVTLAGRIWLQLAEYDSYWLIVTLTGRICSQSKVFCRSALLCRFNIPLTTDTTVQFCVSACIPQELWFIHVQKSSSSSSSSSKIKKNTDGRTKKTWPIALLSPTRSVIIDCYIFACWPVGEVYTD